MDLQGQDVVELQAMPEAERQGAREIERGRKGACSVHGSAQNYI